MISIEVSVLYLGKAAQAPAFLEHSVDFSMSLDGNMGKVLAWLGTHVKSKIVGLWDKCGKLNT